MTQEKDFIKELKNINLLEFKDDKTIILSNFISLRLEKDFLIIQELKEQYKESGYYYRNHKIIYYSDFKEYAEIQEIEYYYKASYYDDKYNKVILNEEKRTEKIDVELVLQYEKKINNNVKIEYDRLLVDSAKIGIETIKKINKKLKKYIEQNNN